MSSAQPFILSFVGDVMLGRLVDQLFPEHVTNDEDQSIAAHFIDQHPSVLSRSRYTYASPWGTTLPLLNASDLLLINLETSVTTTSDPWPDKRFNYRSHPANLAPILHAAHVDYATLANNHTLDFGTDGLVDTAWTLRDAGVPFSGAGETTDQAYKPATLWLPRTAQEYHSRHVKGAKQPGTWKDRPDPGGYRVHVYSASDHPRDWNVVPTFHMIDYSPATRVRLRTLLLSNGSTEEHLGESETAHGAAFGDGSEGRRHSHASRPPNAPPGLKIFSVHWGPNYRWQPSERIRALAHFLIDECEVDIVHGHSSHHVQGVEVYRGKIIIYGCGDFVDDYVLNEEYRNDLGAVWRVFVSQREGAEGKKELVLDRLEIYPTRIELFRSLLLEKEDVDHRLTREKITALSGDLGTRISEDLGEKGQIIVQIN